MKTAVGPRRAQFGLPATENKFVVRLPWDIEIGLERGWLEWNVLVWGVPGF